MKPYVELVQEALDQRAIIDNRNVVDLSETSQSVLIAFNQAAEFMRDLHKWKWNNKEVRYLSDLEENTYPMPYGIVQQVIYQKEGTDEKRELRYVPELSRIKGRPSEWAYKWDTEEIEIAPTISEVSEIIIRYSDKNIACIAARTDGNLIPRFDTAVDTTTQFLNVPEYVYDAYSRCVILKTRVFLNQGAQTTIFPAHVNEWNEAYNGLMSFAKTPIYGSEFREI